MSFLGRCSTFQRQKCSLLLNLPLSKIMPKYETADNPLFEKAVTRISGFKIISWILKKRFRSSQQNFQRFPHSLHKTNVVIGSSADLMMRMSSDDLMMRMSFMRMKGAGHNENSRMMKKPCLGLVVCYTRYDMLYLVWAWWYVVLLFPHPPHFIRLDLVPFFRINLP